MTNTHTHDLDRIQGIYDGIAPSWDARQGMVERTLMGQPMREALVAQLRGDVLEVGAGTGPTLRLLKGNRAVTSYTGIDLSGGMLDQARPHTTGLPFPVTLRQMDAQHLDFPDAAFDSVTTSLTLCTVPDPALALREMARVCRPGGRVVLLEHVRPGNPLVGGALKLLSPLQERMLGCHLDRRTDRLVRELGFLVEAESTRFLGIFHLMVLKPPA